MVLFKTDPQDREEVAIWKLFRTPFFLNLFFDSGMAWKWIGINIPLDIFNPKNPSGDLDILVNFIENPFKPTMAKDVYVAFEVKASTIDKQGLAKSLKQGKTKKVKGKFKKLKKFGCEYLFLFDLYVIETGYSQVLSFPAKEIFEATEKKKEMIQKTNKSFGYIVFTLESLPSISEDKAGMWQPFKVLAPKRLTPKKPFLELTASLDKFFQRHNSKVSGWPVITYCRSCKKLIFIKVSDGDKKILCDQCGRVVCTYD